MTASSMIRRFSLALTCALSISGMALLAHAQDTSGPTPRPDLTIKLSDLPAGYEEVPGLDLMLFGTPLDDRVLRRSESGPGPDWILTSTYQPVRTVTQEGVDFLARDFIVFLNRAMADVAPISGWMQEDASGMGSMASAYRFKFYAPARDVMGDGALAIIGRDGYATLVIVLNLDGESVTDLRRLGGIIDARIDADGRAAAVSR